MKNRSKSDVILQFPLSPIQPAKIAHSRNPTSREERARALREVALRLVKECGRWEECGALKYLGAEFKGYRISYRTPWQKGYEPSFEFNARAAGAGLVPCFSPYGLDVWCANQKGLSLGWDAHDRLEIIGFRCAEWEQEFLALTP